MPKPTTKQPTKAPKPRDPAVNIDGFLTSLGTGLRNLFGLMPTEAATSGAVDLAAEAIVSLPTNDRSLSINDIWSQSAKILWDENPDDWPYVSGIYFDEERSSMYAVVAMGGKLYRYDIGIKDAQVELSGKTHVEVEHVPVDDESDGSSATKEDNAARTLVRKATGKSSTKSATKIDPRSTTYIFRQKDGRYRRIDVACSSVLNRVNEIDTRALFDSFIQYAKENNDYPYYTFYHEGESLRTGQVDFLMRSGDLYITSGLYDDTSKNRLALVEIKARQNKPDYYGISIGYLPTEDPTELELADGVKVYAFTRGIHRECSTLPEKEAAAWFTMSTLGEVTRMKKKAKSALTNLFEHAGMADDDLLTELIGEVDERQREITDGGLVTREQPPKAKGKPVKPATKPTPETEDDTEDETELEDETTEADETDGDSALDTGATSVESTEEDAETAGQGREIEGELESEIVFTEEHILELGAAITETEAFQEAIRAQISEAITTALSPVADLIAGLSKRVATLQRNARLQADMPDDPPRGRILRPSIIRNGRAAKNGKAAPTLDFEDDFEDDDNEREYDADDIVSAIDSKFNDGFYPEA